MKLFKDQVILAILEIYLNIQESMKLNPPSERAMFPFLTRVSNHLTSQISYAEIRVCFI